MSPLQRFDLDAPAKVNLGLRIVGRRADGYHELASVFAPLDLADAVALEVETADAPAVELQLAGDGLGAPPGSANLAAAAASAFLEQCGIAARVSISLTKHTPAGAGLGGGSSDAAAVLRGLARAFPGALDTAALERVALSLGADVPYFLDPRPAWVTGIGERREAIRDLPPLALLLANPGEALATAEVYRAFDALSDAPPARPERPRTWFDDGALAAQLHNDLEPAAVRLCPAIARLRQGLIATGARAVGMSGSGATLFGVFADRDAAERAAARWKPPGPAWTRVAVVREAG